MLKRFPVTSGMLRTMTKSALMKPSASRPFSTALFDAALHAGPATSKQPKISTDYKFDFRDVLI